MVKTRQEQTEFNHLYCNPQRTALEDSKEENPKTSLSIDLTFMDTPRIESAMRKAAQEQRRSRDGTCASRDVTSITCVSRVSDELLDKIDAEWRRISTPEYKVQHCDKHLRDGMNEETSRLPLSTKIDIRCNDSWESFSRKPSSIKTAASSGTAADKDSGHVTGSLSTDEVSEVSCNSTTQSDNDQSAKNPAYDDLDSDVARQLEDHYKHIMNTKRVESRSSSIQTEDYEQQFNNLVVPGEHKTSQKTSKYLQQSSSDPTRNTAQVDTRILGANMASDLESVKTEDFEKQFYDKFVVKPKETRRSSRSYVESDLDTVKTQIIRQKLNEYSSSDSDETISVTSENNSRIDAQETPRAQNNSPDQQKEMYNFLKSLYEKNQRDISCDVSSRSSSVTSGKRRSKNQSFKRNCSKGSTKNLTRSARHENESQCSNKANEVGKKNSIDRKSMQNDLMQVQSRQIEATRELQQNFIQLSLAIRDGKSEKQDLDRKVNDVEGKLREIMDDYRATESNLREVNLKLELNRQEVNSLEHNRTLKNSELQLLLNSLSEKKTAYDNLVEYDLKQSKSLQVEINSLTKQKEEMMLKIAQTDKDNETLASSLKSLKEKNGLENKRWTNQNESLREENNLLTVHLDEMEQQKELSHDKIRSLEMKLLNSDKEKEKYYKQTNEIAFERNSLLTQLEDEKKRNSVNIEHIVKENEDSLVNKIEEIEFGARKQIDEIEMEKNSQEKKHSEIVMKLNADIIIEKENNAKIMEEIENRLNATILTNEHAYLRQIQSEQMQTSELNEKLSKKEVEINSLIEKLDSEKKNTLELIQKSTTEIHSSMHTMISEERSKWEIERSNQMDQLRIKQEQNHNFELAKKDSEVSLLQEKIKDLKDCISDYRKNISNCEIEHAASMEKQRCTLEANSQIACDEMRKQYDRDSSRFRETIRNLEEQLRVKPASVEGSSHLAFIDKECVAIADVLSRLPRRVTFSSAGWNPNKFLQTSETLPIALSNWRHLCDELRQRLVEINDDIQQQKQTMTTFEKEKKIEIEELKEKTRNEKLKALQSLKDRLVKDHLCDGDRTNHKKYPVSQEGDIVSLKRELAQIQRSMSQWKTQTVEKMARKFQDEMAKEIERRCSYLEKKSDILAVEKKNLNDDCSILKNDLRKLNGKYKEAINSIGRTNQDSQVIRRIQILETENNDLKKAIANNKRDLKNDSRLEQCELRAKMAEQRANENASLVTSKMAEISRLHASLSQKGKELLQLEKAYSQLQECRVNTAVYVR